METLLIIFSKGIAMAEVDKETFDVSRKGLGIEPDNKDNKDNHANVTESVVTGEVVRKRKSKIQNVAETFFGGDLKDVASYVVMDVMIPAAKDMLYDTVSQGFSRLLFGEVRPRSTSTNRGYTSYGLMSRDRSMRRVDQSRRNSYDDGTFRDRIASNDFDDITFRDRRDAEAVMDTLMDTIDHYGQCSVADLLKASGMSPKYTDYDSGWRDLSRASISRYRDGYVLNMPRTEDLR